MRQVGGFGDTTIVGVGQVLDTADHRRHRIVHPDVDSTEHLGDLAAHARDELRIRDVARQAHGAAAGTCQQTHGGGETLGLSGDDHDLPVRLGEALRDRQSDAGASTRNDDDGHGDPKDFSCGTVIAARATIREGWDNGGLLGRLRREGKPIRESGRVGVALTTATDGDLTLSSSPRSQRDAKFSCDGSRSR